MDVQATARQRQCVSGAPAIRGPIGGGTGRQRYLTIADRPRTVSEAMVSQEASRFAA